MNDPVVVIGGGLAGLTAAAHLAGRGLPVIVLDEDKLYLGGRIAGGAAFRFTHQGREWAFPTEHGMHALWGGYVNMRATLERFAPHTQLRPSLDEVWVNRWGREVRATPAGNWVRYAWLPAPFHYLSLLFSPRFWTTITPLDLLSTPGFLFSIFWTLGLDPIRDEAVLDGLTLADFFRGWTPNLRATFTGLAVNLLAAPAADISLTGMIAALRFYTVLRRDSWRMDFLPDSPHQSVILPLVEQITAAGGTIWQGAEARSLTPEDGAWRVRVADQARGATRTLYAERVILATDAPAAERLLRHSPDLAAPAAKLVFPSAVRNASVRLWFSTAPNDFAPSGMLTGDFLPDNYFWLDKLYPDYAAWHEATGGGVLEVHLYADDALIEQSDAVLLARVLDDVQRAFPAVRGQFVAGNIRRNVRVQTRFRSPTAQTLAVETPWAGLFACGDWLRYPSPALWMERSCTTAIAAANHVLNAHGLAPYPILQPPPPEPLARALEALLRPVLGAARRWVRGRRGQRV